MLNIPTELLRTLIAVVDLRSFTKAAQLLGITQPAVSAQIKRLQTLLGADLLDKSVPGVSLTPAGDTIVNHARRLLAINDQILHLAEPRFTAQTLRIGIPGDYVGPPLALALAVFRAGRPGVCFDVRTDGLDVHLRNLRQGEIEVIVDLSSTKPLLDARHQWTEQLVWACGEKTRLLDDCSVPLVTYGESCLSHRVSVAALSSAGLDYDVVFRASGVASLAAAVREGLGIMPLLRSRVQAFGLLECKGRPMPKLPEIFCGIYNREGNDRTVLEQLADTIAVALRSDPDAPWASVVPPAATPVADMEKPPL
jgi:DNA-binding transcriptional LysR family regulator